MLKLKQSHTHEMKIPANFRSNPVGGELKWPRSPRVEDSDIDCHVTTYMTHDSLVIPVVYLRNLLETADPEYRKFMNQMIDIMVKDQETITGLIEHNGPRHHYH